MTECNFNHWCRYMAYLYLIVQSALCIPTCKSPLMFIFLTLLGETIGKCILADATATNINVVLQVLQLLFFWVYTCANRPLNPATSYNSNNNGELHACACAAEDIEPNIVIRAKYSAPLLLCWAKQDYGQLHTPNHVFRFSFYCLFVYSVQALWACFVSSSFVVKCHL